MAEVQVAGGSIASDGDVGLERTRRLTGPLRLVVRTVSVGLMTYILLYVATFFDVIGIQLYGAHRPLAYAGLLFLLFMQFPATARAPRDRVPWYDWVFALAGVVASLYAFSSWEEWSIGVGLPTVTEQALGVALVVVTFEGSRRVLGGWFTAIGLTFIVYPLIGPYLPGILVTREYSISGLVQFFYLAGGGSGMFGTAMEIFTTTVAIFLAFGAFLTVTGAAGVFLDAALGLAGRYRGGMGKVAVIASSFFAMISGVSIANVLVTGSFTIPAMKRMGYPAQSAGAIEAAAGTGAILMPPVMGAAAFLMADVLAVPYWQIAVAAFIPGVLYYAAMFVIVDFEGARDGLKRVPREDIPSLFATLKRGWFLLAAIATLLLLMGVWGIPVDQSAFAAIVVLVVFACLRRGGLRLSGIVRGLEEGGRFLAEIGVAGAVVGIIESGFALTGLGALFPSALQALAGDSLLLLLIFAAIASIILGTGAPPLLCYVLLAATVAPAIVNYGVAPIAAHLFIFYFGMISVLTPPVALSAMIAAQIAGSEFWRTSMEACRLAVIAFIIPFFFVYQPSLLLMGTADELALAIVSSLLGVLALGGALARYFFIRGLPFWERVLLGAGGILMLYPTRTTSLIGLGLMMPSVILTILSVARRRRGVAA